jgi:hypothetical protein
MEAENLLDRWEEENQVLGLLREAMDARQKAAIVFALQQGEQMSPRLAHPLMAEAKKTIKAIDSEAKVGRERVAPFLACDVPRHSSWATWRRACGLET